jgi:hypothetical protein
MNREYRYDFGDLGGDYFRSIAGITITAIPFVFVRPVTVVAVIIILIGATFALFLAQTLARHLTRITVDSDGIRMAALAERRIDWNAVEEFSLAYFSTWRSGGQGWMQLKLKGMGRTMHIVSKCGGFNEIVGAACAGVSTNGLAFDPATIQNLAALGIADPNEQKHL